LIDLSISLAHPATTSRRRVSRTVPAQLSFPNGHGQKFFETLLHGLECDIVPSEKTDTKDVRAWCANHDIQLCSTVTARSKSGRSVTTRHKPKLLEIAGPLPASLHVCHVSLHASRPTRSKATRAGGTGVARITACVPFFPMATTWAEKPHATSLPSLPSRHTRHLRGISSVGVPSGSIRPGSLPLSHFSVNPIRMEMATLIKKPQILTVQQFILRPLHLRPLTVVPQDLQDGNGISNGEMLSKSEPHGRTFCQVLQKPSRFIWRPISPIMALLRRFKGARIRAQTSALQDPARHFLGSMVAGNCLFDMASRRCGQKRHALPTGTTIRQQDSY